MKKNLLALAVLCAMTSGAAYAQQQDGQWLVRARAVHLDSSNGGAAGAAGVSINDKWIPEVDVSYFFTPNLAAELILTYPQKHDVRLSGAKIGTVKHLPPTLLAQYHFTGMGAFKPYVGAGINYTRFMDVNLPSGITTDKDSFGFALQFGVDVEIAKNMYLNFDYKRVNIETDVKVSGAKLTTFKVDPDLISVGIGWRF